MTDTQHKWTGRHVVLTDSEVGSPVHPNITIQIGADGTFSTTHAPTAAALAGIPGYSMDSVPTPEQVAAAAGAPVLAPSATTPDPALEAHPVADGMQFVEDERIPNAHNKVRETTNAPMPEILAGQIVERYSRSDQLVIVKVLVGESRPASENTLALLFPAAAAELERLRESEEDHENDLETLRKEFQTLRAELDAQQAVSPEPPTAPAPEVSPEPPTAEGAPEAPAEPTEAAPEAAPEAPETPAPEAPETPAPENTPETPAETPEAPAAPEAPAESEPPATEPEAAPSEPAPAAPAKTKAATKKKAPPKKKK